MKTTTKTGNASRRGSDSKRIVVEIDVTEIYERLRKASENEVRTIEEQCKYLIKKGLDGYIPNTMYVSYNLPGNCGDSNVAPLTPPDGIGWRYPYAQSPNPLYNLCGNDPTCMTAEPREDGTSSVTVATCERRSGVSDSK